MNVYKQLCHVTAVISARGQFLQNWPQDSEHLLEQAFVMLYSLCVTLLVYVMKGLCRCYIAQISDMSCLLCQLDRGVLYVSWRELD